MNCTNILFDLNCVTLYINGKAIFNGERSIELINHKYSLKELKPRQRLNVAYFNHFPLCFILLLF